MQCECKFCKGLLKTGDEVMVAVNTLYKEIPSKITFALGRDFIVKGLFHIDCWHQMTEELDEEDDE